MLHGHHMGFLQKGTEGGGGESDASESAQGRKRVLLEHIPFIWKRLGFLQKVSVRNVVRYKKRFFMMVIGISGCTALLVTGFGVRDSVTDIADQQYEKYSSMT